MGLDHIQVNTTDLFTKRVVFVLNMFNPFNPISL